MFSIQLYHQRYQANCRVLRLTGIESINLPFQFVAHCQSDESFDAWRRRLGSHMTLKIEDVRSQAIGYFSGLLERVQHHETYTDTHTVCLTLTPWLCTLKQRIQSRTFQPRNSEALFRALFSEYPEADYACNIAIQSLRVPNPLFQHNETDYAFVQSLLGELVLCYHYTHSPHAHRLQLYPTDTLPTTTKVLAPNATHRRFSMLEQTARHPSSLSCFTTSHIDLHAGDQIEYADKIYRILSIQHDFQQQLDTAHYGNRLLCTEESVLTPAPKSTHYRAPHLLPLFLQTEHAATISTRTMPSAKAQLPWDIAQQHDIDTTPWASVTARVQTKTAKSLFLPHHSTESLALAFTHCDDTRCHVLGGLYSPSQPSPAKPGQFPERNGFFFSHTSWQFDQSTTEKSSTYTSAGQATFKVGEHYTEHIQGDQTHAIHQADQVHTLPDGKKIVSAAKIELIVGQSRCTLTAEGIFFNSPNVVFNAGSRGAARAKDAHTCPATGPGGQPHVGGPIRQGSTTVWINQFPAARVGDLVHCMGATDKLMAGSQTVFINGKAAARAGDSTAHHGSITQGSDDVQLG